MVARGNPLPTKLQRDAIVEAIFEIRFNTTTLSEVLAGRLSDTASYKGFQQRRLPAADLPAGLRESNEQLRFQATIEFVHPSNRRSVRIGPHVLSCHRLSPYVGWETFRPELEEAIEALYSKAESIEVNRLGLRYINALTTAHHFIRNVKDLDLGISIANEALAGSLNLNFMTEVSNDTLCTVRIATKEFAHGTLPPETAILVDVDVGTTSAFSAKGAADVKNWANFAHAKEKEEFFHLLKAETVEQLRVKND